MADRTESPPPRPADARQERTERLAAQLRANLRRRKDQVRGREAGETASPPEKPDDDA